MSTVIVLNQMYSLSRFFLLSRRLEKLWKGRQDLSKKWSTNGFLSIRPENLIMLLQSRNFTNNERYKANWFELFVWNSRKYVNLEIEMFENLSKKGMFHFKNQFRIFFFNFRKNLFSVSSTKNRIFFSVELGSQVIWESIFFSLSSLG